MNKFFHNRRYSLFETICLKISRVPTFTLHRICRLPESVWYNTTSLNMECFTVPKSRNKYVEVKKYPYEKKSSRTKLETVGNHPFLSKEEYGKATPYRPKSSNSKLNIFQNSEFILVGFILIIPCSMKPFLNWAPLICL